MYYNCWTLRFDGGRCSDFVEYFNEPRSAS
jgi:hypothetical protein